MPAAAHRVAVLATGAELVPLGDPAGPAQVHDSSRHGVAAQLAAAGAEVIAVATVGDDLDETVAALGAMLDAGVDVVVTCGGISGGPHDHVRAALEQLCVEEVMRGVQRHPHPPDVARPPRAPGGAGAARQPRVGRRRRARAGPAR